MNKTVKWSVIGIGFLVLMIVASVLYNEMSKQYAGENLSATGNSTAGEEAAAQSYIQAPDFVVQDVNGNGVRLSDYRGKPVVINFWATWCQYCKMSLPAFEEASAAYPDVQFLMVNATDGAQETVSGASSYVAQQGYTFDVFYDTAFSAVMAYGVNSFPQTFFVDAQGRLVARAAGRLDLDTIARGIDMIPTADF